MIFENLLLGLTFEKKIDFIFDIKAKKKIKNHD